MTAPAPTPAPTSAPAAAAADKDAKAASSAASVTAAPAKVEEDAEFASVDRKGVWWFSNASYPLEDPTNAQLKNGRALVRFEPRSYTQAEATSWMEGQWRAGVLKKFDSDPRDEGAKELTHVAAPAPASK